MKKIVFSKLIQILLLLLIMASCKQPETIIEPVTPVDFEMVNFQRAEELYQEGAYTEALQMYLKYMSVSSNTEMLDKALYKIGSIYSLQGNYEKSAETFNKLLKIYPDSVFASSTQIALLLVYIKEEKYSQVIEISDNIISKIDKTDIPRILFYKGYALLKMGNKALALENFINAYESASNIEKDKITKEVTDILTGLSLSELKILYDKYQNEFPGGYILFNIAQLHIKNEDFKNAVYILSKFIENFPNHERIPYAQKQITTLQEGALTESYTIGCILPLTGVYSKFGNKALAGVEFALFKFNTTSGAYQVKLKVKDTESTPEKAARAVQELANQRVRAIIGPITTAQAEAAALSAQALKIPIITLTSKDNITEIGDYVFRNFITHKMQVKAITSYAAKKLGIKKFAILYPNDSYGMSYMDIFWDAVIEQKGTVTGVGKYKNEQTDFADTIKKITGLHYTRPGHNRWSTKKLDPIIDFGAVFIPDAPEKIGLIAPQLAFHDINNVKILGTNLLHDGKLLDMAKPYVQGAIMPDIFFEESLSAVVKDFVNVFEQAYGTKPGLWEAISYDTANILFNLVIDPRIGDRESLKNALLNLGEFKGVTGKTIFQSDGNAQKQLFLITIKDDKFVEIEK